MKLTWKRDGIATAYYFTSSPDCWPVLLVRQCEKEPGLNARIEVIRAIRRYAPQFADFKVAKQIWENRTEIAD